jgi:hypothetical protein
LQIAGGEFADRQARFNFDIGAFMAEHGLQEPVAANFFKVDGRGGTGVGTGGPTATSSGGLNRNTLEPFQGGASGRKVGGMRVGFVFGVLGWVVVIW